MRRISFFLMLPLAACGGGGDERGNEAAANEAAAAQARVPPQKTPVLDVPADADNRLDWIEPQQSPGDRPSAPYGNLLDAPVATGAPAR